MNKPPVTIFKMPVRHPEAVAHIMEADLSLVPLTDLKVMFLATDFQQLTIDEVTCLHRHVRKASDKIKRTREGCVNEAERLRLLSAHKLFCKDRLSGMKRASAPAPKRRISLYEELAVHPGWQATLSAEELGHVDMASQFSRPEQASLAAA